MLAGSAQSAAAHASRAAQPHADPMQTPCRPAPAGMTCRLGRGGACGAHVWELVGHHARAQPAATRHDAEHPLAALLRRGHLATDLVPAQRLWDGSDGTGYRLTARVRTVQRDERIGSPSPRELALREGTCTSASRQQCRSDPRASPGGAPKHPCTPSSRTSRQPRRFWVWLRPFLQTQRN